MSHNANAAVWAFADPDLTPMQLLVLVALADYANPDTALLWPSLDNVATRCHVSRSTVKRAITELVAGQQLERVQRGGRGGHETSLFRFCLVDNLGLRGVTVNPQGGHSRTAGGSLTPLRGFTGEPQKRINPNEPRAGAHARRNAPSPADDPAPDPAELTKRMNEVRAKGNYAPKDGPA
jgi:hypothetical protein